jgi:hypothetical protein
VDLGVLGMSHKPYVAGYQFISAQVNRAFIFEINTNLNENNKEMS